VKWNQKNLTFEKFMILLNLVTMKLVIFGLVIVKERIGITKKKKHVDVFHNYGFVFKEEMEFLTTLGGR
jgi:hypothetical protein